MKYLDDLKNKSGDFIATKNDLNIDDQLKKYGVRINANLIEDLRSTKISIITGYSGNKPQESLFDWPYFPLLVSDNQHAITKGLDGIKCNFVSSINIESERVSNVNGIHEVRFSNNKDLVTFKHEALSRNIFSDGAIAIAKSIIKKEPDLYSVKDFFN